MADWLVLMVWLAPLAIVFAVARNRGRQREIRASTVDLRVDDFGVHRELADGRVEEVDWSEIREVSVVHTRRGPHRVAGGMVVLYGSATRGCIVPLDLVADSGVVEGLSRLPGFDVRRLADALDRSGSHDVWVHPDGGFEPGDGTGPGDQLPGASDGS